MVHHQTSGGRKPKHTLPHTISYLTVFLGFEFSWSVLGKIKESIKKKSQYTYNNYSCTSIYLESTVLNNAPKPGNDWLKT